MCVLVNVHKGAFAERTVENNPGQALLLLPTPRLVDGNRILGKWFLQTLQTVYVHWTSGRDVSGLSSLMRCRNKVHSNLNVRYPPDIDRLIPNIKQIKLKVRAILTSLIHFRQLVQFALGWWPSVHSIASPMSIEKYNMLSFCFCFDRCRGFAQKVDEKLPLETASGKFLGKRGFCPKSLLEAL